MVLFVHDPFLDILFLGPLVVATTGFPSPVQAWVDQARKSLKKAISEKEGKEGMYFQHLATLLLELLQFVNAAWLLEKTLQDIRALFRAVADSEAVGLEPEA